MRKKKKVYPLIEGLEITKLAAEGKAMGKYNDIVVFVPSAVPGDVVDVQIRSKRRSFMEGTIVNLVKPSPIRCEPFCEHFGVCGGCKWQNIPYDEQLKLKQEQVFDQLSRISKVELPEIASILGSEKTTFYRNKLEYTFADKRWLTYEEVSSGIELNNSPALGFHIPKMFDKVLNVNKCWLQDEPSNEIRLAIADFCRVNEYDFYNARDHKGFMRNLIIRTSTTGDVMVIVVFAFEDEERRERLLNFVATKFTQITSLLYIVNKKLNDSNGDQDVVCYRGEDHIFEQMEGLKFKIGGKSFYQTNSEQAYNLYKITRDFAGLTGSEVVYDLYTGTGTIANFVAKNSAKVVGVEYVPEAIEDAVINSQINGIENTVFYAGDMKDILNDAFISENGKPDVIILDPPRAGIHEDVAHTIIRAQPTKIVYVSCNPATQARDLAIFDSLYRVTKVQPVDMFPHTHHVENVVLLEKR